MNPSRENTSDSDYASLMLETYKNKISGPILDRIDLWLEVPRVDLDTLTETQHTTNDTETTGAQEQIRHAREKQAERLEGLGVTTNAEITARDIDERIALTKDARGLLRSSTEKLDLSPRSYHRLIKVSRTIADLDASDEIESDHILEALQYRVKL